MRQRLAEGGVVGAAGVDPGRGRDLEARARHPDRARRGQLRQRRVRGHHVDRVDDEAEAVAEVDERGVEGGALRHVEDEARRVGLAADPERVDLERGLPLGDRGADLEHVRPEHLRALRVEVVGVVLHEGRAARKAAGHHLRRADEGRGLPVALGPEPVAVGHQALDGEAGKLGQAVEVLERRGEGGEAALPQEGPHPGLDPGLLAQVGRAARGSPRSRRPRGTARGARPSRRPSPR